MIKISNKTRFFQIMTQSIAIYLILKNVKTLDSVLLMLVSWLVVLISLFVISRQFFFRYYLVIDHSEGVMMINKLFFSKKVVLTSINGLSIKSGILYKKIILYYESKKIIISERVLENRFDEVYQAIKSRYRPTAFKVP